MYVNTATCNEGMCGGGGGDCGAAVGLNQTEASMYVNTDMCNDGGGGCVGVGINQTQYIIKGMTCGMGVHLV